MKLESIARVYFVGIGGIGMSALARFFVHAGKSVAGYDRTPTSLTAELEQEGMLIHYDDNLKLIPVDYLDADLKRSTLVIFTPAVPVMHAELSYFRAAGYSLMKRAQVLGLITREYISIAVAGSHGKSTLSAMIATIFQETPIGCSAFLGAISKNFNSNLVLSAASDWAVLEADEFDRSFLQLEPSMALVTSMDPDHLDIYGEGDQLKKSFIEFLGKVKHHSTVLLKFGLDLDPPEENSLSLKYYGFDNQADYYPENIRADGFGYIFDLITPDGIISGMQTTIAGWINVENAVGAAAICLEAGLSPDQVTKGVRKFEGVKRRFDIRHNRNGKIYMDDYAHHPKEIHALLKSVRKLFPEQKILGVFQPHLFSRTKDFAKEFGEELSALDELILMDIYPAREEPMPGVSSLLIKEASDLDKVRILKKDTIVNAIRESSWDVLLTIGAGDIDRLVLPIEKMLNEGYAE
ncbi:MAG: UDP-N-acetylmuramate--L-alanine ligase [Bacteroidales bacterium]|nr:UDP-N-acetylmuramate--L-alanine ligase [Bacteroidales bacterium]